jgi:diguanylate cyclase (GGDEF)-like protein
MTLVQKAALDALPYGIVITDPLLRIELVNAWLDVRLTGKKAAWRGAAALKTSGLFQSNLLPGTFLLQTCGDQECLPWLSITRQLLSGEIAQYSVEFPNATFEMEHLFSLYAAPLHDLSGQITGLIFNIHDISERLEVQNQLYTTNYRLGLLLAAINIMNEQQRERQMMLDSIVWLIADVFSVNCVMFVRLNPQDEAAEPVAFIDNTSEQLSRFQISKAPLQAALEEQGMTGLLTNANPVLSSMEACQHTESSSVCYSVLYSFISSDHKPPEGFLIFSSEGAVRFTPDRQEVLAAIAQQLGIYLENAALYAEQQRLAVTDGLTGLCNRRRMDEELTKEILRANRFNRAVSVLILDIDNFKHLNDTFGHPAGDRVLKNLAQILQKNVRSIDIVARYGGEEFTVILPETDEQTADLVANRLRLRILQEAASVIWNEAPGYRITVSVGVATVPAHGSTSERLLQAADEALYQAKRKGKNQVVIAQAVGMR